MKKRNIILTESQMRMVIEQEVQNNFWVDKDGKKWEYWRDENGEIIYNDTEDNRFRSPARRSTLPPRPVTTDNKSYLKPELRHTENRLSSISGYNIPQTSKPKQQPLSEFDEEDLKMIED